MPRRQLVLFAALVLLSASLHAQSSLETKTEVELRAAFLTTVVLRGTTTSDVQEFAIDSADQVVIRVATNSTTMVVSLVDPATVEHPSGVTDAIVTEAEVRGAFEGSDTSRVHTFVLSNPPPGVWKLSAAEPEPFAGARVAILSMESSSKLVIGLLGAGRDYPVGRIANPAIVLFDSTGPVLSDSISQMTGKLSSDAGAAQDIAFLDNGVEPDQAANDGIYSAKLALDEPGTYTVAASVSGTRGGEPFNRAVAEHIRVTEPCAVFDAELSSEVIDENADEVPEGILIEIPVRVTRDARVHALVVLEAQNELTASFNSRPDLAVGTHTIEVRFEASLLASLGADGPYEIKEVSLSCLGDDGSSLSDIAHALGQTPPFELSETGLAPTVEVASLNESAVDDDANELFDRLNVAVEFAMLPPGDYDWRAVLADSLGGHIDAATGSGLLGAGNLTANVTFRGTAIGGHAVDGPYNIVGIELFGPEGSEALTRVGGTRSYTFDQFEGAPDRPSGPLVGAGGVVDAASFQGIVAPGGIGSLFGSALAATVEVATGVPLPRALQGLQLTVDGRLAPLFFVSSSQVNFQIPFETAVNRNAEIAVIRDELTSNIEGVRIANYAPAVFLNSATAEPIVTRHPDGALIAAGNPAKPQDVLTVFVTGVGDVTNVPATGASAGVPLSTAKITPTVTVAGVEAQVLYAGLAPFFVGLAQINIIMPDLGAAAAPAQNLTALPLVINFGGAQSKPVNLPVSTSVAGTPAISVSAASLDFGNVNIGQASDQTLMITNTETAVLSVSGITSSDPQFSVVLPAGGFSVAPGATQLAAFRFTPAAVGVQQGTLTISNNDPSNPALSIGVRGAQPR